MTNWCTDRNDSSYYWEHIVFYIRIGIPIRQLTEMNLALKRQLNFQISPRELADSK